MCFALRLVSALTFMLISLLALIVFVPRAVRGAPTQDWLTYSLCRIPCWRNIRPGQTKFMAAEFILRRMPDVEVYSPVMASISGNSVGGFSLNIKGNLATGTIHTNARTTALDDGVITNITFNDLLTTRLIDVTRQIGVPYRVGSIKQPGHGALLMFDFRDQHVAALANVNQSTLEQLCTLGFEQTRLDYLILHDGTPNDYPGTLWSGFDGLSVSLCDIER